MVPRAYRSLLQDRRTRRLLAGLGASSLGDGMSTVTIAWLAVRIAPANDVGLFVGLAIAAYTLPGVIGAVTFGPSCSRLPWDIGGPLVGSFGASATLAISGVATLLLAAAASVLWTGQESRSDPSGIEKRPPSGGE